jgi:hypothetical protein
MADNPAKHETAQVVEFPTSDERARRLRIEVDRLARLPTVEWMFYLDGSAEKHGIDKAKLKQMVASTIKAAEKKEREDKGELRRREKQKSTAKRDDERKQERKEREEERKEREDKKEAERKERDKQKTFEMLIKLPSSEHEGRLKALAKRIGEDIEVLRIEFEEFAREGKSEIGGDIVPWPDPVDTKAVLTDVMKQLKRYVVLSDDQALAITLWIIFAWLHESTAVHSPLLVFKSVTLSLRRSCAPDAHY